jgi:hypothetical protein
VRFLTNTKRLFVEHPGTALLAVSALVYALILCRPRN